MTVSRGLRRLLRVRELEEEQRRLALESALAELHQAVELMDCAQARGRMGRELLASSVHSGEIADRLAGLEESRSATQQTENLAVRLNAFEAQVEELRATYLATRVERRQAEALIEETEARDAVEAARSGQQDLDEWHRARRGRNVRS
ncbi:MAG TPA: hypothetical protein VE291_08045 [Terracidiphilus sp.]|jgi:flagellar biosynthesis chaperone FliJ|nr:hypothetical protein [Terracidiphilus sp.]